MELFSETSVRAFLPGMTGSSRALRFLEGSSALVSVSEASLESEESSSSSESEESESESESENC